MIKNLKIKTRQMLFLALVGLMGLILTGFTLIQLLRINHSLEQNIPQALSQVETTSKLNETAQFIRYYDEVLTQSARNYAYTGNDVWLQRYNDNIPKLEEKIKTAIEEGSVEDKKLFDSVDSSNQALIKMETASQNAVKAGNKAEAVAILESNDYAAQKKIYAGALEEFKTRQGAKYDDAIVASTTVVDQAVKSASSIVTYTIIVSLSLALLLTLLTIVFGRYIALTVSYPIEQLSEVTKKVADGDLSQSINIDSRDEIGDLSKNFNAMVAAVKQSRATVDEQVRAQTSEILKKEKFADGQRKAILNVLEDLKVEKEKIQEISAKDEAFLSSIGDAVLAVDIDKKIILANRQVENLLGFKKKELLNHPILDVVELVDEKDQKIIGLDRPVNKIFETHQKLSRHDLYYVRKDKTKFPVSITGAPIMLNNKFIGAIDIFRDITHEREVDKAKTEFVSLASHQLRTPLSAVKWYAEMLLAGDVGKITPKQKNILQKFITGTSGWWSWSTLC